MAGWLWLALWLAPVADEAPETWFPAEVAGAPRLEATVSYNRETVFDYMDGRAEVYLTYAFQRVLVTPYQVGAQRAEVMLFDLSTPAEAFGIYSNSYEGEPVEVLQGARWTPGTLRAWQGRWFLRVEGVEDTPELRRFATELARLLQPRMAAGPPLPPLVAGLPLEALKLRDPRYFHHELSLATFYYLSTQNVLQLGPGVNAVFADGEHRGRPLKAFLVEYPTPKLREQAFLMLVTKLLSRQAVATRAGGRIEELAPGEFAGLQRCLGPRREARLALCVEVATRASCEAVLAALTRPPGAARQ